MAPSRYALRSAQPLSGNDANSHRKLSIRPALDWQQRDLLKDTLVIWAGEFGRTPHGQNGDGRDHNQKGYTTWMAGGGVKGASVTGRATDDHGYEAIEGRTHIHDWHATIMHLLGFDHEKLTYPYAGRDFRLTDVHGSVVKEILG